MKYLQIELIVFIVIALSNLSCETSNSSPKESINTQETKEIVKPVLDQKDLDKYPDNEFESYDQLVLFNLRWGSITSYKEFDKALKTTSTPLLKLLKKSKKNDKTFLWKGGSAIKLSSPTEKDRYMAISYYGAFIKDIQSDSFYQIPEDLRDTWKAFYRAARDEFHKSDSE